MTVGFAMIFALILSNSPSKIRGLSEQQQDWLCWNYASDQKQQDHSNEITAKQGFLMAVRDPKTWLLCGILYATHTAAAVNNFFPTVVGGLGFSRTKSYGLTAPPFVLCVICMLINGFHSDKVSHNPTYRRNPYVSSANCSQKQERFLHIALPLCVTVVANIIAVSTLNVEDRHLRFEGTPVCRSARTSGLIPSIICRNAETHPPVPFPPEPKRPNRNLPIPIPQLTSPHQENALSATTAVAAPPYATSSDLPRFPNS